MNSNDLTKFILDEPIEYTITNTLKIVSYSLTISKLILNKEVEFILDLYDDSGFMCDQTFILITGNDYNQWGKNDEYIDLFVKKAIEEIKLKYI